MFVIRADVVGRAAFDAPILGVPEIVQFSIVGIVFLQLPQTLRAGGLTRSELLMRPLQRLSPRAAGVLQALYDVTGAVLFALILAATWPLAVQAFESREFYGSTGVVQIPTGPLKVIIIAGCAVMTLQFLLSAWTSLRAALGGSR
jgi:TRAP-type C4-dicarboxylate transport system permease small subunit